MRIRGFQVRGVTLNEEKEERVDGVRTSIHVLNRLLWDAGS